MTQTDPTETPAGDLPGADLAALAERPELWPELEPGRLVALAASQIGRYGASPDEVPIERLQALYGLVTDRLAPVERLGLLDRVQAALGPEPGAERALYPFIMGDPDPAVAAHASRALAVLTPPEADDPLAGPRRLRALAEQDLGEPARLGLLEGLLLLGDRRALPFLRGGWELLSPRGRARLAAPRPGLVYAATVDFLLEWLAVAEPELRPTLAEALAGLAAAAERTGVLDVELALASRSAAEQPAITVPRQWSRLEYGRELAPRLDALAAAGVEVASLDRIRAAWGPAGPVPVEPVEATRPDVPATVAPADEAPAPPAAPVGAAYQPWGVRRASGPPAGAVPPAAAPEPTAAPASTDGFEALLDRLSAPASADDRSDEADPAAIAAQLRARRGPDGRAEPLVLAAAPPLAGRRTLLAWAWSAPPGPLRARIDRLTVPASGERLLVYAQDRPTGSRYLAFDLLPAEAPTELLVARLEAFFATNGAAGWWLLTASLPASVHLPHGSPLPRPAAARLFALAHAALVQDETEGGGRETEGGREAEDGGRKETEGGSRGTEGDGGLLRRLWRRAAGRDEQASTAPAPIADPPARPEAPSPIWLSLASHPDWVARVEAELAAAWRAGEVGRRETEGGRGR